MNWENRVTCECTEHPCNNSANKGRFSDLEGNILCGHCYYGYHNDKIKEHKTDKKRINDNIIKELEAHEWKVAML